MHTRFLLATDYAPYITGLLALIGSFGGVVGAFYLNRKEERLNWLKNQRQEVYPKFIAAGQAVHDACDELSYLSNSDSSRSIVSDQLREGYREFVVHNALIQTLGSPSTIEAARTYMYTLLALRNIHLNRNPSSGRDVDALSRGARKTRHQALLEMRRELDVPETDGLMEALDRPIDPVEAPAREARASRASPQNDGG